ncbi:hypothetical protein Rumeso_01953 [Rubellimicrobium mesophilum DSM 19309]|uniref:Uncharacterized protein n=1 Tax=Rubellimicrobium mesophilum DSM 19309 TaxID=442562 RepID=A0A017HPZ9_9RHOB|nr:hypothetical protein [Rubellimicrobium mesophilum]EYD76532.1 hypothetical protein Rumeso_01953 [Rubellimicrobium mesophilum DSM 19309]
MRGEIQALGPFAVVAIGLTLLPGISAGQSRYEWGLPDDHDGDRPCSVVLVPCSNEPCLARIEVHNGLVLALRHVSASLRIGSLAVWMDYDSGLDEEIDTISVRLPAGYYAVPAHLGLPEDSDGTIRIFQVPLS